MLEKKIQKKFFLSFWMILKIQIMHFQELFTESKKLAVRTFSPNLGQDNFFSNNGLRHFISFIVG